MASEAAKSWIEIGAVTEIIGEDLNGNGLIDNLKVNIAVTVVADGDYSIVGALVSTEGVELDYNQNTWKLTSGTSVIQLVFDGKRIHANGKDGPYSIAGFTVFGPVFGTKEFKDAIVGYRNADFEAQNADELIACLS